jgi:teichuronic acid biosynthesis glycosyltransferase TuaH
LGALDAIAAAGHSLLLVGDRQATFDLRRATSLLARPNVQWVGARRFEELPSYLQHIDVGVVPYAQSAFNRASFPLKTLEYLAAGRAVVSSDLPAVRWLGTDLVRIAATTSDFLVQVRAAIAEGSPPALMEQRKAFAREHSWSRRVAVLASALELAPLEQPRALHGAEP